ncbi:hypothetical protein QBC44DRAFT_57647 [Cladorrhinum sp. PSN332]|nr:hypothetical protein QBC44DRAFT_57647 [Cladorrhinum sp. PSN332]
MEKINRIVISGIPFPRFIFLFSTYCSVAWLIPGIWFASSPCKRSSFLYVSRRVRQKQTDRRPDRQTNLSRTRTHTIHESDLTVTNYFSCCFFYSTSLFAASESAYTTVQKLGKVGKHKKKKKKKLHREQCVSRKVTQSLEKKTSTSFFFLLTHYIPCPLAVQHTATRDPGPGGVLLSVMTFSFPILLLVVSEANR